MKFWLLTLPLTALYPFCWWAGGFEFERGGALVFLIITTTLWFAIVSIFIMDILSRGGVKDVNYKIWKWG